MFWWLSAVDPTPKHPAPFFGHGRRSHRFLTPCLPVHGRRSLQLLHPEPYTLFAPRRVSLRSVFSNERSSDSRASPGQIKFEPKCDCCEVAPGKTIVLTCVGLLFASSEARVSPWRSSISERLLFKKTVHSSKAMTVQEATKVVSCLDITSVSLMKVMLMFKKLLPAKEMSMHRSKSIVALIVAIALWRGAAYGLLVTDSSLFTNPIVIDFSQFAGCSGFAAPGCTPSQNVGGLVGENVIFTGTTTFSGASLYNGVFSLNSNGNWNSGRNGYVGINGSSNVFARFTFSEGLVSAVGGFESYAPGVGSPIIRVLDSNGNIIESYNLSVFAPIVTPAQNAGAFRGIVRLADDIAAIEYTGGFQVIDNLTFSRESPVAVPEPSTLLLLGSALAGFGFFRRRKTAN